VRNREAVQPERPQRPEARPLPHRRPQRYDGPRQGLIGTLFSLTSKGYPTGPSSHKDPEKQASDLDRGDMAHKTSPCARLVARSPRTRKDPRLT